MSKGTVSNEKVMRGRPFYGVDLGILLLDGTVPRAHGDIGNARTYDFPVTFDVAVGVRARDMHEAPTDRVKGALAASAERLSAQGVKAVVTSCGLMANHQTWLTQALDIPVATSSLLQIPMALRLIPAERRLAVVTIDPDALTPTHFSACGVDEPALERLLVAGVPDTTHFFSAISRGGPELDVERAGDEIVSLCRSIVSRSPDVAGLVLECTNLSAYAGRLRRELGLPIWDAVGLARWLAEAVSSA